MIKCVNVISDTNIGGAGKLLLSFLKNYDREKFDMTVVVPRGSALIPEINALQVPCMEFDGMADKSYDKADIKKFETLFAQLKPQVVHCHATLSARIAAKRCGCRVISTRHSVFDQPAWKKMIPFKWGFGFVNNHYSDVIIAVSPAAKENVVEIGTDPKRVTVVFNGVDPAKTISDEEKQQVRQQYGVSENDFVCAIIARLEEVKGHSYVLQAAKRLQDACVPVKIIIAGTGTVEQALKRQAVELELTNVIFAGFVTEVWKIENIMDLQLNASYGTEATSLSLLEGMSLGKPAVVSDFGGNPYVIEDGVNGLVIPKKNAEKLAEAILRMKNDRTLYEAIRAACPGIFKEKFTAQAMTKGIEAVYEGRMGKETT